MDGCRLPVGTGGRLDWASDVVAAGVVDAAVVADFVVERAGDGVAEEVGDAVDGAEVVPDCNPGVVLIGEIVVDLEPTVD